MKLNSNLKTFKDIFDQSLLTESGTGMNITNIASGKPKKDKYFPPTVEVAPAIKYSNPDIPMGQPEYQTDAPQNLLYPFESVFSEMVGNYIKLNESLEIMRASVKLPTLSTEKKTLLEAGIKQLTRLINELKSVIEKIEQLSI
jgi:hypothetical protein